MSGYRGYEGSEQLRGRILRPADLIEYQGGAIVSRTIIDKPSGTVTLFALDKGQSLSVHTSPYDAVVQVCEGKGRFYIDDSLCELAPGSMLIMPAHVPHRVEAAEPFKMLLTMIRS